MTDLAEGVREVHPHLDRPCVQCGDPVPGFQNMSGNKWMGNPVLYMGFDDVFKFALKYQFCDAECLLEWLAECLGRDLGD